MGSLQGRASIYDLQKKPVLNGRFFCFISFHHFKYYFSHYYPFLFNPYKKPRHSPRFLCLLYLIFYGALFHPIINLIRNLKPDLCLLLWRQGVACIVQRCEAGVF